MDILRGAAALAAIVSLVSAASAELDIEIRGPVLENVPFSAHTMHQDAEDVQPENVIVRSEADCGCCQPRVNCCCYLPRFYGYVEAVFLHRDDRAVNQQLVYDTLQPSGNNTLASTGDFDFDFEPGIRVLLGYQITECWAIEFGYLGGLEWASGISVSGNDNLAIPGDLGLASNDFYNADRMQLDYSSNLNSYEINLVKTCCCCCCCVPQVCCEEDACGRDGCAAKRARPRSIRSLSIFTGFRYLALNEVFNIRPTDLDEGSSDYNIRTENDLYGWQIGATVRRCRGRFGWDLTGKAGIYGNSAEQSQSVSDFPPPFMLRTQRSTREGNVAFVGELGLSAWYQLGEHFAVRCGYNLLWIEGVALAPDQLDFTYTPNSGTALYAGNGVFLHGVSVGVEAFF